MLWRLTIALFVLGHVELALAQTIQPISRIAFGSCARQERPQPIWESVVAADPQLFIFLGDNIYGDTEDMTIMRQKYALLGAQPGFLKLRERCPIIATWDDHDFGKNDAGREYPKRAESKIEMLTFFQEPPDSERWKRDGVYDAKIIGPEGKRVQIILLDTRWFRSSLMRYRRESDGKEGFVASTTQPNVTILGDAQWTWLEDQLKKPAELRILASSIQVLAPEHRFEKWHNFADEYKRLLELIGRTNGVIIISGDRHYAELCRLPKSDVVPYDLFDITSSSLNQPLSSPIDQPSPVRIGNLFVKENFGVIQIDWEQQDPSITLNVRDIAGQPVLQQSVKLSELKK